MAAALWHEAVSLGQVKTALVNDENGLVRWEGFEVKEAGRSCICNSPEAWATMIAGADIWLPRDLGSFQGPSQKAVWALHKEFSLGVRSSEVSGVSRNAG